MNDTASLLSELLFLLLLLLLPFLFPPLPSRLLLRGQRRQVRARALSRVGEVTPGYAPAHIRMNVQCSFYLRSSNTRLSHASKSHSFYTHIISMGDTARDLN